MAAARKKCNFELIPEREPAYELLERALEWHELEACRIALAWRLRTRPDKDGRLVIGKCVKISDLQKEFANYDFVITLNQENWMVFSEEQRLALLDHELEHMAAALDKTGLQRRDERGRLVWRYAVHEIEEFRAVIRRHGLYKKDLEEFAAEIRRREEAPLLNQSRAEVVSAVADSSQP